ncbi:LDLR chaperone boca [Leptopilina heterotoma]|uniref:LDLR chaperone boca n=1 Tax=Leptopilina heterotoma TaxID=63436 RepID=UPI001CA7CC5B|nr:LDLR chaperone boca [Leptopilina heterotoma]
MKFLLFLSKFPVLFIILNLCLTLYAESTHEPRKKSWKDKDIRDMTDADLEHILDQWEENEDPLEPDELPEHLRPPAKVDISKIDMSDPDNVLRATKKGKGVMMFVDVRPDVSVDDAKTVMQIWQTSLNNNHIVIERYPIEDRRSIFMFREGSQAVEAKNFLIAQKELQLVTLEGQTFTGQYALDTKQKTEL